MRAKDDPPGQEADNHRVNSQQRQSSQQDDHGVEALEPSTVAARWTRYRPHGPQPAVAKNDSMTARYQRKLWSLTEHEDIEQRRSRVNGDLAPATSTSITDKYSAGLNVPQRAKGRRRWIEQQRATQEANKVPGRNAVAQTLQPKWNRKEKGTLEEGGGGGGYPSSGGREDKDGFHDEDRTDKGYWQDDEPSSKASAMSAHRDVYRPPVFFRYAVPIQDERLERPERLPPASASSSTIQDTRDEEDPPVVVPVATLVHDRSAKILTAEELPEDRPCYRQRRCRMLVCVQIVVVVALVVGLVTGLRDRGESTRSGNVSSSSTPTLAPTTLSPTQRPTDSLALNVIFQAPSADVGASGRLSKNNNTPLPEAFQASFNSSLEWFGSDTVVLGSNDLQRFVLAWLWYQTTGNGLFPWVSCNPPENFNETMDVNAACVVLCDPPTDDDVSGASSNVTCDVVCLGDNETDVACTYWSPGTHGVDVCYTFVSGETAWLSDADECDWVGVTCNDQGVVTALELSAFGLQGRFPYFLYALSSLETLDLSYGGITGELPAEMGGFSSLTHLNLARNQLHGSLPASLFTSRLLTLDLSFNGLNKTLPEGLDSLEEASLSNNYIPGPLPDFGASGRLSSLTLAEQNGALENSTIPASWGRLLTLRSLDVSRNGMQGTIPEAVSNWMNMQTLHLYSNNFHGDFPSMPWPNLRQLSARNNAFNGTFPESLYGHANVQIIDLSLNRLGGPLLGQFQGMSSLRVLDLADNRFTGDIPRSITDSSSIVTLRLNFNDFEGSVPPEFCDIEQLEADCLDLDQQDGTSSVPPVTCACCTRCCDPETRLCRSDGSNFNNSPPSGPVCDATYRWDPDSGVLSGDVNNNVFD